MSLKSVISGFFLALPMIFNATQVHAITEWPTAPYTVGSYMPYQDGAGIYQSESEGLKALITAFNYWYAPYGCVYQINHWPFVGSTVADQLVDEQNTGYCASIGGLEGYVDAVWLNYNSIKTIGAPPCGCAGDPINLGTGNEYRDDEDLSFDGLSFHRYYNSDSAASSTHIGAHWRHSFDRHLLYESDGTTSIATVFRPDGKLVVFNLQSGQWVPDPDISDRLTSQTSGTGAIIGWAFFDANTRNQEMYDADGYLSSTTDSKGQVTTLTYSTASTPSNIAPSAGLLLTVTNPRGRALSFTYNAQGYIATLSQPDGTTLSYAYDTNGNMIAVTYPDTKTRQYVYNEGALTGGANLPNALTGEIDESGVRLASVSYSSDGLATMSTLSGGINLTKVATSLLNGTTTSSVTYPSGVQATFSFVAPQGTLLTSTVSNPCGAGCGQPWKAITYDANGYPASYTDFNNNLTKTTYDSVGLMTQRIDASGTSSQRTTNFNWNTTLRVPLSRTVLDASGKAAGSTQWVYNTRGQALARCAIDPSNSADSGYVCSASGTVPAGVRRWTYTYCDAVDSVQCPLIGLMLTSTGPRTDLTQITSYSYFLDSSAVSCGTPGAACHQPGDLHTITDALGHVTTIVSYDADGRITRETDANGVNTDFTYTPRGWLASRSVGGATTTVNYTPYGAVASITNPDGVTVGYTYDAAHRLTDITDALGNRIHYTLDAAGNKTAEQVFDSAGTLHHSLSRSFNKLGQLTAVVDGRNQTVYSANATDSYDADGNLVHSTDGLGIQQHRSYDALNRLISFIDNYNGTDTATSNTTSKIGYDSLDRLTQVTDPSNFTTTYRYDGLSNAVGQVSPDTGSTSRTFDAAGNELTSTDAKGITATHTYDSLERLTSTRYSDSTQNVSYDYDEANNVTGCSSSYPVGRLTRIVENAVTTVYCYDTQGRVIEKQQITSTTTNTIGYSYTTAGRLSGLIYPSGTMVAYTLDGDGRIQSVSVTPPNGMANTAVSNVTYQPFGPVCGYTLGNGQVVARAYDANYRLTDLSSPDFSLHVARDVMGDTTAIGNSAGANPATETYSYDPLHRLTQIAEANGKTLESVTYNPTGDRLSKTGSGLATGTYSYVPPKSKKVSTHQLFATGTATRSVDADGNTTAINQASATYGFAYSARNRMVVAQLDGSTVGSYTYDALGERIHKVAGTADERYSYDEGKLLLSEQGTTNRDYVWMDGFPVANVDTSGTTSTLAYVTSDQLGTPRAISNSSGATLWQWAYQSNAWGELSASGTGYTYNLRFPGQYFDQETGLSYNGYRDYDSSTGRYIESDPMGLFAHQSSTFAYARNNPQGYSDSLGLDAIVLVNPNGAATTGGPLGHAAVLVGNNQSGWNYYSENGMINDVQYTSDISYATLADFEDAFGNTYPIQVGLPASAAQDAEMNAWAEKHLKDTYNEVLNNCGDFVKHVLQAGNIKTFGHRPTIPNEMYDELQQENGAYIPDHYHQTNQNWNNYPQPVSSQ